MELTTISQTPELTCLALAGILDAGGAAEVDQAFQDLAAQSAGQVVVDFSAVEYMASAGMRMLILAAKSMAPKERKLVILSPSKLVSEVMDIAGLVTLIPIARSMDEARGILGL